MVQVLNWPLIFFSTVLYLDITLLSTLNKIDCKILESTDSYLTQTILHFDTKANTLVLNATIDSILSTERFEEPLF